MGTYESHYEDCRLLSCSFVTLCDPLDCSPPGSPVHGISQTRVLEWVAISFSRGSCRPRHQTCVSCTAGSFFTTGPGKPNEGCLKLVAVQSLSPVRLFVTPWTVAYQAPPSMGFPRQEYWSGLPLPSPQCRRPGFNPWVGKIP